MHTKILRFLTLAFILTAGGAASVASGATLSYVLSGNLTGTLGATPLNGAAFQLVVTGNASGGLPVFASTNSLSIAGAGSGTFTNPLSFTFSGTTGTFLQGSTSPSIVASFSSVVLAGWNGVSQQTTTSVLQGNPATFTVAPTSLGNLSITGLTNLSFSAASVAAPSFSITTNATLPAAAVGFAYSQPLAVSGGMAPYNWTVISGALPPGLSLSSSGTISGTPTATGPLSFTVNVTDSASNSATQTFSLTVGTSASFSSALRVPQIVDGAGWKTRFAIINTDQVPVTFTLQFWADSGTPLALPFQDGTAGSLTKTLQPGASFFAQSAGTAATLQQGWGEVAATGKLGLTAIFQFSVGGPRDAVGTEIATLSSNSILMPFDNTQANVTAVAIANTNATQPLTVTMLYQTEGGAQSSVAVVLPPHAHQAFVTTASNPASVGVRGSIQFTASSPDISVIGLEFTPAGQFTSLGTFQ